MSWVRNAIKKIEAQDYEILHQTVFGSYGTKPNVSRESCISSSSSTRTSACLPNSMHKTDMGFLDHRYSGLSTLTTCQ